MRNIYGDIDADIESAILKRDIRWLHTALETRRNMQPKKDEPFAPVFNRFYLKETIASPVKAPKASPAKAPRNDSKIKNRALEHILKNLPFKVYDECVSKQRSKGFYISKENLVKKITDTPELKKFFPKSQHLKLNKEQICTELFDDKKTI